MAESYYQLGQNEKANKIIDELANKSLEYMIWYLSLNDNQLAIAGENFVYNASLLDAEVRLMEKYKSEELAKHYSTQLDQLYNEYVTRMKGKQILSIKYQVLSITIASDMFSAWIILNTYYLILV